MTTRELTRVDPLEAWGLNPLGLTFGRLFDDVFARRGEDGGRLLAPPTDVWEDEDSLFVSVELPGMKKDDIELSLHEGCLSISGERRTERRQEDAEVHRSERFVGRFQRTLSLPAPVAADKITAQYKDGVLTVTLPKTEEAKPKQIDVKVG